MIHFLNQVLGFLWRLWYSPIGPFVGIAAAFACVMAVYSVPTTLTKTTCTFKSWHMKKQYGRRSSSEHPAAVCVLADGETIEAWIRGNVIPRPGTEAVLHISEDRLGIQYELIFETYAG